MTVRRTYITDALATFAEAETTTDAAASTFVKDLGPGARNFKTFDVVFDVDAIDVSSGNEVYSVDVELGDAPDFGGEVARVARIALGAAAATPHSSDTGVGRYALGVSNAWNGTLFRYLRLVVTAAGTTPSITWGAFYSTHNDGVIGTGI